MIWICNPVSPMSLSFMVLHFIKYQLLGFVLLELWDLIKDYIHWASIELFIYLEICSINVYYGKTMGPYTKFDFFMTIEVAVQYMWGCFSLANVKLSLLKRYVPFFIQNIIICCRTNLAASNWKLLASCEMIHLRGNGSLWLPLGSDTISLMANSLCHRIHLQNNQGQS